MASIITLADEARYAFDNLLEGVLGGPSTLRLGVTGLSRAGKTVFITALVHNLIHGGRLPLFDAYASGRLAGAKLQPQPDDAVPRFDYESHVRNLVDARIWPRSTRRISELRVTLEYESASTWKRTFGPGRLDLDIVDYPGEWLLDLALLNKSYGEWSAEAVAMSREPHRQELAAEWHHRLQGVDPDAPADELKAQELAGAFTSYLRAARADEYALSMLPPGRFLMPGDLEGSPALTFSPLDISPDREPVQDSLAAMMARRYESYRTHVVKPFFRNHFARLDRQIVLVDMLAALNAGPAALRDLEQALADVLACFRPGRASWLTSILSRRIDKILFAATKADHVHRSDHDNLGALLARLTDKAAKRAEFAGAEVRVMPMAAVRATREVTVTRGGRRLPAIAGVPLEGEEVAGEVYDGASEIALFPGDLPKDPESIFEAARQFQSKPRDLAEEAHDDTLALRYLRFRPPRVERSETGLKLSLPHIRLDQALQFLVGDRLQ
ncbi:YcjX family protein [Afifella sp. H1R]|uniref:YcjX family protein n=1 Tax=Afifella sp. H1R TaxID=2908841 RepID=UPI00351CCB83